MLSVTLNTCIFHVIYIEEFHRHILSKLPSFISSTVQQNSCSLAFQWFITCSFQEISSCKTIIVFSQLSQKTLLLSSYEWSINWYLIFIYLFLLPISRLHVIENLKIFIITSTDTVALLIILTVQFNCKQEKEKLQL